MYRKVFIITVMLLFLSGTILSQLSLDAMFRPRTEYRHGYKTLVSPADDPAFFTSQRTRLNLGYGKDNFRFNIALQDIRTWGNTSQLSVADGLTSLYQGWAEVDIGEMVQVRVGRQELIYDDHRIFGNVGWAQQGRTHDLALVKVTPGEWIVHAGLAFNQDKEQVKGNFYTVPNNYKTMQFLWVSRNLENLSLTVLFINNGLQYRNPADNAISTPFSQTFGANAGYQDGELKITGSVYYQFGKDGLTRKLNAYQASVRANYALADKKWEPLAGIEILSGTDQSTMATPGNEKNNSFTPFYGTNHKFNGHMDYFYVGNHVNSVGLVDIYAGLVFRPGKIVWNLAIHQFASHAKISDPTNPRGTLSNNLGTEVDMNLGYKQSDLLTINAGYSQIFATASMQALKGGDHKIVQYWAWVMLTFTPKFLNPDVE